MAEFRGSARNSGFNAINLPDNARRVQQAGNKRVDELRRVYAQSIDNEKSVLTDLQQSYGEVRTALDRNERLYNTYEKSYEAALRKRYEQKLEKSKKEAELERGRYDRLSDFSKEAAKFGKELYDKHKDERQRDGMALVFKTGLTAEELQSLRRGEDELQSEHAATNAIIDRLKARGASASEIKQIQELDGWILYGAQKEIARKGADAYRFHLNNPEVRNKKYDLGDGRKLSLQDALESGNDVDYKTVRGIISGNFLDRYKGYDLAFAEEYLFPGMRKVEANDDLSFTSKAQEQFEKEQTEIYQAGIANVLSDMEAGDTRALEKFLLVESGGQGGEALGRERKKFFEQLIKMYQDRRLSSERTLALLESQQFTIGGKTVTFADQFMKRGSKDIGSINTIKAILTEQNKEEFNNQLFAERKFHDQMEKQALDQINGDGLSEEEIAEQRAEYARRRITPTAAQQNLWVKRSLGIDERIQYEQAVALAQDVPLTTAQVRGKFPNLSATQVDNVVNLSNTRGPNGGSGMKDYTDQLVQEIKSVMQSSNKIDPGAQTVGMVRIMKRQFTEDVLKRKQDPKYAGYSFEALAQDVLVEHTRELKNGEGIYQRIMQADGKTPVTGDGAGFTAVGAAPIIDSPRYQKFIEQVDTEPKSLNSRKLLGDINDKTSWASQIPLIVETQEPTFWLTELARATNTPWKVLFNKQAALYGDYRLPLSRLEDAAEGISPDFRTSMHAITASSFLMGSTLQARTQGANGTEVYRPILNMMASFESSNDTEYDGYDAMNLGGTHGGSRAIGSSTGSQYFKRPLIDMTVGEILDLQAAGQLHAAGRYQFIGGTIEDIFNRGNIYGINRDSKFDANTQDLLAIAYLRLTIRDYPTDPTTGIRSRWIGVKDHLTYEETQEYVQRILVDPRYQGTAFENHPVDPTFHAHMEARAGR